MLTGTDSGAWGHVCLLVVLCFVCVIWYNLAKRSIKSSTGPIYVPGVLFADLLALAGFGDMFEFSTAAWSHLLQQRKELMVGVDDVMVKTKSI